MIRYHARLVLPVARPPIERGTVAVREGRIAYVGPTSRAPSGVDVDLGHVALLPGLVNAHTHLELTAMRGSLEELAFAEWIDKLRASRNEILSDTMLLDSARHGIAEGLLAGITTYAPLREAGINAREPTSTRNPPLTTSMTRPPITRPSANASCKPLQSFGRSAWIVESV